VRVIIKKDFGDSLFKNIKTLEYNEEEFKKFIHSNNINKIGYIDNNDSLFRSIAVQEVCSDADNQTVEVSDCTG